MVPTKSARKRRPAPHSQKSRHMLRYTDKYADYVYGRDPSYHTEEGTLKVSVKGPLKVSVWCHRCHRCGCMLMLGLCWLGGQGSRSRFQITSTHRNLQA